MTVCELDKCAGCMLCLEICKRNAISIKDSLRTYNAVIDEEKCVNCNACHERCPQNNAMVKRYPIAWYQGWNNNEEIRANSPSGGVGMALATAFAQNGGYVCSCIFEDGKFVFGITNDYREVQKFGGSKYVKSNPAGIYSKVLELLNEGNKVLFIGLPCQVAAVKQFVGRNYKETLFLVDLICHGTPSPKLLDMFLKQYSKSLATIKDIKFRLKAKMQIVADDEGIVCKGVSDKYTIGFLNGLTYTDNCYSCGYASIERISDITIGDSWGSGLQDEKKNGISLLLIQTPKGMKLLEDANISLYDVDLTNAVNNNEQLSKPMNQPNWRLDFFKNIEKKRYNLLISKYYRKQCLKQDVKLFLIKIGLIK